MIKTKKNYDTSFQEKMLRELGEELETIVDKISYINICISDHHSEKIDLEERYDEIKASIKEYEQEIKETQEKEERDAINDTECGIKCSFWKKPSDCKKEDKLRCPFLLSQKIDTFIL